MNNSVLYLLYLALLVLFMVGLNESSYGVFALFLGSHLLTDSKSRYFRLT